MPWTGAAGAAVEEDMFGVERKDERKAEEQKKWKVILDPSDNRISAEVCPRALSE